MSCYDDDVMTLPFYMKFRPPKHDMCEGCWTGRAGVNLMSPTPIHRASILAPPPQTSHTPRASFVHIQSTPMPPKPRGRAMSDIALLHHHRDLLGQRNFDGMPLPETRPTRRVDYRRPGSLQGTAALATLAPTLPPRGKRTSFTRVPAQQPRRSSIRCTSLGGRHPDTVGLLGQSVGAVDTAIEWDSAASRRRRPLTAPCLPAVHQAMARALQHEQQAAYSYFQRRGRVSRVVLG